MNIRAATLAIVMIIPTLSACTSVKLREDVFLSSPIWESADGPFVKLQTSVGTRALEVQKVGTTAPALAGLVEQVLKEPVSPDPAVALSSFRRGPPVTMEVRAPLPAVLAEHPVVRATVLSMRQSWLSAQGVQTTGQLPNLQLSLGDYKDFIAVLHQVALAPYRSPRWTAIKALGDRRLTWEGFFQKYVTAYYNGEFVDRTGGVSSKPKLGLTSPMRQLRRWKVCSLNPSGIGRLSEADSEFR